MRICSSKSYHYMMALILRRIIYGHKRSAFLSSFDGT
nr:MAG TPA: hypothetical protein [Caudoviricetes sp.]